MNMHNFNEKCQVAFQSGFGPFSARSNQQELFFSIEMFETSGGAHWIFPLSTCFRVTQRPGTAIVSMLSWWKMGVTKTRHLGHLKIIKKVSNATKICQK